MNTERSVTISRLLNILALLALLGVLAGSLHLQFGVGEQPCPLCLVQRSGMFGLAIGPAMNLWWGIRARHYALSILAACAGSAGSIRQVLLHIYTPSDPGYGPAFAGYHLYTWALITFIIAIVGCAVLLLWETPLLAHDRGIRDASPRMRILAFTTVFWTFIDLLIVAISVIPECQAGMCPDDPANIAGVGDSAGWILVLCPVILAFILGLIANRKLLRD